MEWSAGFIMKRRSGAQSEVGVIHGRFQPLHLGHMEYLLEGKKRCKFLYIGITNPDPSLTKPVDVNPHRSEESANPFTYYERQAMLVEAMLEVGVKRWEFEIVPFPINVPGLLRYYTPTDATYYVTIYDEWGDYKLDVLNSLGLKTEVMWRRSPSQRLTSGAEVRELMRKNGNWESLVPPAVAKVIRERGLEQRVKQK